MGTCWGIFETLTCTYAAEISPVALRPYLTSYVNLYVLTVFSISCDLSRFR